MKHLPSAVLVMLVLAGLSKQAVAQGCTSTTTPAAFGAYTPTSSISNVTTATVTVVCSATIQVLVAYTVALSAGNGTFAQRQLMSGSNTLAYQLYMNPQHSQVWGDGTLGTAIASAGYLLAVLTPVTINYTAYGQAPALQNVAPGTYLDTVMVTISY